MADAIEDETLERDIPAGDIEAQDPPEVETPEGDDAEDEVHVSFEGEEAPPASGEEQDSSVIRKLREENRKKDAELKALKAQVPPPPQIEVGPKPTLADCDYDEERYDEALLKWNADQAKAKQAEADAQRAEEQRQAAWKSKMAEVETKKSQLGAKDYDRAAEVVKTELNDVQQALIVRAADDPAKMIYALGKSPQKLAEFAKIEDPVAAIAWLVKMEGKLTVSTQRKPPAPETIVRGSAPLSAGADKHLEKLEAEAAKTGDRTKVYRYKRELKAKGS